MIVVDASVAVKWFLSGEHDSTAAAEVLDKIVAQPKGFAVPELFFNEMLAVLARSRELSDRELQTAVAALESLGFHRVGNGHDLLQLAAEQARRWRLTGYDAIYLATATLLGGVWLTADARAAKRVSDKKLVRCL